jgi:YVTN family beta-propeller protein
MNTIMKAASGLSAALLFLISDVAHTGQSHALGQLQVLNDQHRTPLNLATRIRRPVALALVDGGALLLTANRRSGSLSVIDTATRQVLAEHDVGLGLSAVCALPDNRHLIALDQAGHVLLLLERRGSWIQVRARVSISPDPIRLAISPDGLLCAATSRWSRRLSLLDLRLRPESSDEPTVKIRHTLDLPFSPCEVITSADGSKVILTDAFGGRIALVDSSKGSLESIRSIPANNIRGLALRLDGKTLIAAQQTLNPLAHSTFDDIHWGLLISNQLRAILLDRLLQPGSDLLAGSHLQELGDVGHGAGDPSSLSSGPLGSLIVTLGGVNEVAVVPSSGQSATRIHVGQHPVASAIGLDGRLIYVADALDDTVSVIEIGASRRLVAISLGPRPELNLVDRGERLFFDAQLSHDGWMSCHSCHTNGHTCGLRSDTLGDGSYEAPKQIPSLLGVGSTGPWTWTGSVPRLEDQVRKSIQTTMHEKESNLTEDQVNALTAYLHSLGALSPALAGVPRLEDTIARGQDVFNSRKCGDCHTPPMFTSSARFDVGITDEVGNRTFNPPSLRGVCRKGPFFHDGRAKTLEDVFLTHRHPRGAIMAPREVVDLVTFLNTL